MSLRPAFHFSASLAGLSLLTAVGVRFVRSTHLLGELAVGPSAFQVFFAVAGVALAALNTWRGAAAAPPDYGLAPSKLVKGMFLTAGADVARAVILLSPLAAFTLLLGGVVAGEVVLALIGLLVSGATGAAYGLSLGSWIRSTAIAVRVALLTTVPLACWSFQYFGWNLSTVAHNRWPPVPERQLIWLPIAYMQGGLSTVDWLLLLVAPAVCLALVWLLLFNVSVKGWTIAPGPRQPPEPFTPRQWAILYVSIAIGVIAIAVQLAQTVMSHVEPPTLHIDF